MADKNIQLKNTKTGDKLYPKTKASLVENLTINIDKTCTDIQIPSAKAVYDLVNILLENTVEFHITNGSITGPGVILKGKSAEYTITANTHCNLPVDASKFTIGNATIVSYDKTTGKLIIKNPEGKVTITTTCEPDIYNITANITNGTINKTSIKYGESIEITLSPSASYELPTTAPTVSNGTISGYDSTTGKFTLSGVTANTTITASCPLAVVNFLTCGWNDIKIRCDLLENGTVTTTEFCALFTNGSTPITSMDDFVDLGRKININSVEHTVRVIGTQHDTISGGTTKAALTFQLVELMSNSTGTKLTQKFNASSSSPYYNIWNDGSQSCDIRNYLRGTFKGYLPSELQSAIKTIKKKTSAGNKSTTVNELDETIFLLSQVELNGTTSTTYKDEGTIYSYWSAHNTNTDRIKKDKSGEAYDWWLRSPGIAGSNYAFVVYYYGKVNYDGVDYAFGVAPAFAI